MIHCQHYRRSSSITSQSSNDLNSCCSSLDSTTSSSTSRSSSPSEVIECGSPKVGFFKHNNSTDDCFTDKYPDIRPDINKPHYLIPIDSDKVPDTTKENHIKFKEGIDNIEIEQVIRKVVNTQQTNIPVIENYQHYIHKNIKNQRLDQQLTPPMSTPSTPTDDDSSSSKVKRSSFTRNVLANDDSVFESMSMISPAFTPVPADFSPAESLYGSQLDLAEAVRVANKSTVTESKSSFVKPTLPKELLNGELNNKLNELAINESVIDDEVETIPRSETSAPHVRKPSAAGLVERSLEDSLPKVFCESRARIPTTSGTEIYLHLYSNNIDNKEHLAIVFGQDIHSKTLFAKRPGETEQDRMTRGAYVGRLYPGRERSDEVGAGVDATPEEAHKDTLVRIHSECYTGETAWSARCDCGEQLDEAARLMAKEGCGVIVYLRQEGRGIGLGEKLKAYNLQDLGADTVTANLMLRHPADARSFSLATAILLDLGLEKIRLLTNNPDKIVAVQGKQKQITVTQRVPMIPLSWQNKGGFKSEEVDKYLQTKVQRMGHLLNLSTI